MYGNQNQNVEWSMVQCDTHDPSNVMSIFVSIFVCSGYALQLHRDHASRVIKPSKVLTHEKTPGVTHL